MHALLAPFRRSISSGKHARFAAAWLVGSVALGAGCAHDWSDTAGHDAAATETETGSAESPAPRESVDAGRSDAATEGSVTSRTSGSASDPGAAQNPGADAGIDAAPALDGTAPSYVREASVGQGAHQDTGTNVSEAGMPMLPEASTSVAFCEGTRAEYCEDFEKGATAISGFTWTEVTTTSQARLAVVEHASRPGSRVLSSSLTGAPDESARAAFSLSNKTPSSFRAAFDFLPQLSLPMQSESLLFWFKLTEQSKDAYPGVSLASRHDGTFLVVQNYDGTTESFDMFPTLDLPSGWTHVEISLTFGPNGSAAVRYNGQLAAMYTGPLQVTAIDQTFAVVGLYSQSNPASSALYDNITYDFSN